MHTVAEKPIDRALRPQSFDDYQGQPDMVERLRIAVAAAKGRDEPLEHVLLSGPPGTGKTTMANILANEMGGTLHTANAPALTKAMDLVGIVTKLRRNDVLFVDELHRLPITVEEVIYPAMEDFRIDVPMGEGLRARSVSIPLQPFTLIGATTRTGLMSAPMRARFGINEVLTLYSDEALAGIVHVNAERLGAHADPDAAMEIARRSRGTPRIANNLLRRARDYADIRKGGRITLDAARESLRLQRIDPLGLGDSDRAYLRCIISLYGGGPVGVEALAATLHESPGTLADVIEPHLLRIGFLQRTRAGRVATEKAKLHMGL